MSEAAPPPTDPVYSAPRARGPELDPHGRHRLQHDTAAQPEGAADPADGRVGLVPAVHAGHLGGRVPHDQDGPEHPRRLPHLPVQARRAPAAVPGAPRASQP
eukprot:scaffold91823_cov66-Phaeocystis_antarctica.AAC.1